MCLELLGDTALRPGGIRIRLARRRSEALPELGGHQTDTGLELPGSTQQSKVEEGENPRGSSAVCARRYGGTTRGGVEGEGRSLGGGSSCGGLRVRSTGRLSLDENLTKDTGSKVGRPVQLDLDNTPGSRRRLRPSAEVLRHSQWSSLGRGHTTGWVFVDRGQGYGLKPGPGLANR